ncbi:mitochondrial glycerol-3-phosphate dehydrogenase [Thoreauomyces humboldtii]|nr:mitochondrial glycerol-3-phosphate dehydrogenase [Thoreauomyces humboldtii]
MWRNIRRPLALVATTAAAGTATVASFYAYSARNSPTNDPEALLRKAQKKALEHAPSFLLRHPLHAEAQGNPITDADKQLHSLWTPPSRKDMISALKASASGPGEEFDLLIVGGGATGTGCAVDGATRGLKIALVERDDFASGTSSRSTKLVHGGVRYLEKAFWELDYEQYKLVKEALHERGVFLKIAPFLSYQLPTMIPLYKHWKVPYYWAGCKAYDLLAYFSGDSLSQSYFLSKSKALEAFPLLKKENLVASLVYYDGAHNDARMNVALALTAVAHGAVVANHTEVVRLLKKRRTTLLGQHKFGSEEIYGAIVRDSLTGEEWEVRAKGVINATGPFTDGLRKLDSGMTTAEIVAPSSGTHIVLPSYYSPRNMGLIDPATSDGRVIFFLPWQGSTIAGTTDAPCEITSNPIPSEKEITWILNEIANYLSPDVKVRRGDVLAAWSGIRPLVRDPHAKNTAALVRNHMINVSESGLLTIAGGKWTTYREMAAETIDRAVQVFELKPKIQKCITEDILLVGSHNWNKNMFIKLVQHFGIELEVAQHLTDSYGDRAWAVASLASLSGNRWPVFGKRLSADYPYIEAEVRYAVQREYACTAVDVIARRTRLAFLNAQAALEALPRVIEIMAEELKWSDARKKSELVQGKEFLKYMGLRDPSAPSEKQFYERSHFRPDELATFQKEFTKLDTKKDGRITEQALPVIFKKLGISLAESDLQGVVASISLNRSGGLEFNEFLEVLGAVRDNQSKNRAAASNTDTSKGVAPPQSPVRSGGGV